MITPQTIRCLNAIQDASSITEGVRDALKDCRKHRRINGLAKVSGVSQNTMSAFLNGHTDSMYLHNAEEVLKAMGLRLYVRIEE